MMSAIVACPGLAATGKLHRQWISARIQFRNSLEQARPQKERTEDAKRLEIGLALKEQV
jgi:hypothetical protein